MIVFQNEEVWRPLTYIWTVFFLAFIVVNFVSRNHYEFLISPLSVLYTGVLTLYVGTKEFDRWYEIHEGRHPGEWFVLLWTVLIFLLFGFSLFLGESYRVPSDITAVYVAVLSLFAITQKSKTLYIKRQSQQ